MSLPCPECPRTLQNESDLQRHLYEQHNHSAEEIKRIMRGKRPGYYEAAQETPEGRVSIDHQINALKSRNAANPATSIPMIPTGTQPQEPTPPAGWVKDGDNSYSYQRMISETHNYNDTITKILTAKVSPHHGIAELHTFTKDISELRQLQEKEEQLSGRMQRYVVRDPEFPNIAIELHNVKQDIRKTSNTIRPTESIDLVLEQYFDTRAEEDILYQQIFGFMNKTNEESDRLISNETRAQKK